MFKESSTVFQEQIKGVFEKGKDSDMEGILRIIDIVLHNEFKSEDLIRLYRTLGIDNLFNAIHVIGGKTVRLPKAYDVKDAIILALCYYRKEIKGDDWKTIKKILPFEISSISYGTRIKNLNTFIRGEFDKILQDTELEI